MVKLLQSLLLEPYAANILWTHEMVKRWSENEKDAREPAAKKPRLIQYPPIVLFVEPGKESRPSQVRMLVNDTFSDSITATIVHANTVSLVGVHTPAGAYNNGMRPEDDIPHRH